MTEQMGNYRDGWNHAMTEAREDFGQVVETYDEYIKLLAESEAGFMGLAYAHGYRCPDDKVQRGKDLRAKIADLKSKLEK